MCRTKSGLEFEVEIDDNETELEVEIKWSSQSDGMATDSV